MDNHDTISHDIACSEYATGKIETARTFLALCLFERQRRAAKQRSAWRGADTRHATRTLLLERYATAASKYNWDAVAWFRAVCLARSCECDTVVLIVPDIRNIYRVIYMDNVDTI